MSEECNKFVAEAEAEAKRPDHNLTAGKWKNGGFCFADAGNFLKASECFQNSAEESLKGKDKAGASDSFLSAVVTYLRAGKQVEASNVVKAAETKGLSGTDNIKLASSLLKAVSSKDKGAKQKVYSEFSFLIEDNYWLRKTLEKMGVTPSAT